MNGTKKNADNIFLYVVSVGLCALCFYLFWLVGSNLKKHRAQLLQKDSVIAKKQSEIDASASEIGGLKDQLNQTQQQLVDMKIKMQKETLAMEEFDSLRGAYEQVQVQAKKLEIALKQVVEERDYLQLVLDDKSRQQSASSSGSVDLGAVRLGGSVIRNDGKISALDSDRGIAIVDLGRVNGLGDRAEFEVRRQGVTVAWLSSTEIRDVMSACKIKKVEKDIQLQIGDSVVAK